jgi:hypothetical protein
MNHYIAGRNSDAAMGGGGGAQRPVLRVDELKKTRVHAAHGRARAAKTHL